MTEISRYRWGRSATGLPIFVAGQEIGVYFDEGKPADRRNLPAAWARPDANSLFDSKSNSNQWNIALQREVAKNLSVEAAYVGNRSVWLEADNLVSLNAITPATFKQYGIDIGTAAGRNLLTTQVCNQTVVPKPFAAFPCTGTVAQALRPFPEYNDGLAERWAPLGSGWYDALQVKVTKRLSHGLDVLTSFSWQKEQALGNGAQAGGAGPGGGGINDAFNRANQKSLQGTSTPFILVTAMNYTTPRFGVNKLLRQVTGGWVMGGVLRYASGPLIAVPGSRNSLGTYTLQPSGTRMNRVPGQALYLNDPNCACIDPTSNLVLNPAAWQDAPAGQWGSSAPYYNDYRWQHQANEDTNFGRTFQLREKMSLQVRAEFFNAMNRLKLTAPSSGNPTKT